MTDNHMITTIYDNWKGYQEKVAAAIAPLTAEQLTLRAAPHQWSVGRLVEHMVGARVWWIIERLGEDGAAVQSLKDWDREDEVLPLTAAELVAGLDLTWQMIANALARWSATDMEQVFTYTHYNGEQQQFDRAWVIYHLLEHDLHHGGEVSLTLGAHGLEAPDI